MARTGWGSHALHVMEQAAQVFPAIPAPPSTPATPATQGTRPPQRGGTMSRGTRSTPPPLRMHSVTLRPTTPPTPSAGRGGEAPRSHSLHHTITPPCHNVPVYSRPPSPSPRGAVSQNRDSSDRHFLAFASAGLLPQSGGGGGRGGRGGRGGDCGREGHQVMTQASGARGAYLKDLACADERSVTLALETGAFLKNLARVDKDARAASPVSLLALRCVCVCVCVCARACVRVNVFAGD